MSVRTRALAAVIALAALAMAAAGVTAYSLERDHAGEIVDDTLARSASEIRTLIDQGVDPSTGAPFDSVDAVIRAALSHVVPAPNEAMAGFTNGSLTHVPEVITAFRIQDDPQLLQALRPVSGWSQARIITVQTNRHTYRVLGLPVHDSGGSIDGAVVLAFNLDAEFAEVSDNFRTYGAVAVIALIWITIIGWFVMGRLLAPLTVLRTASAQITGSDDLSRRIPVRGNDDLAALTETFNDMLARLDQAFASQRQLLDDVGHELRTPLTIVRGHLELMDPQDREDAAATRTLVLDELDRMNLLVEDLMTLARARRPDFIVRATVDVAQLTDETLTKAQQLGQRQWRLDDVAEISLEGDEQRLTQAWLQLASNAVKFSGEDSVIAIGSRYDPARQEVRLWVRDEGVGISAQDQQRVFTRFTRLDRSVDGTGLGLSIVSLIAQAHGGRVELESEVGAGSTFTVVVPLAVVPLAVDMQETE
ncbi:MAG TPA: ATP-binding protein [Beutenbergiaceae bacterium]|nr:ATP-binding protein [Beutenbergiaceae bacterium]